MTSTRCRAKSGGSTHRGHGQGAMPAEKGVRDGHTDALSGTAVLGGEGHFSLLDTVGDRGEGRSSIRGLLDRGTREDGKEGEKQRTVRHICTKATEAATQLRSGILERDGFLAQFGDQRQLPRLLAPLSLPYARFKAGFHTTVSTGSGGEGAERPSGLSPTLPLNSGPQRSLVV